MNVVIGLILLSSSVIGSCPCGGAPKPSDETSSINCNKINSVLNGIIGKNVCQCHTVVIKDKRQPHTCKLKKTYNSNHDQPLLYSVGTGYTFYRIFQPGYYTNQCYSNKLFCAYNVQCAPNQLLYYHFSTHDIENPTSSSQCLDILTITRDSLPNQELPTCGRVNIDGTYVDFGIIQSGYETEHLRVRFRSNKKCSSSGYFLWVVCINITEQFSSGCIDTTTETVRRREVKEPPHKTKEAITVPLNGVLKYHTTTLTVAVDKTIKFTANHITSLIVRSVETNGEEVYQSSYRPQILHGEGELIVKCSKKENCTAMYNVTGVPLSYRLTLKESQEVDMLLSAVVSQFKGEDYHMAHSILEDLEESAEPKLTFSPYKPTEPPLPHSLTKQALLKRIANRSRDSCKAIVRSVGKFYLQVKLSKN